MGIGSRCRLKKTDKLEHRLMSIQNFKTKIFGDGADKSAILRLYQNPAISGFTTNPTLMRKAGVSDYKQFAREILEVVTDKPISFEVFSDEFDEMEAQALEIASWGENIYVKIPITNTRGQSSAGLIERLSRKQVKVNVTAMMTLEQVKEVIPALSQGPGGCVSLFAGRIADAGVDPEPIMIDALKLLANDPALELIWASPREVFNIVQANRIGCHIITVTDDLLKKTSLFGKDLLEFSLDTVKMFYNDAHAAGFTIDTTATRPLEPTTIK
jgi:transaldolase